MREYEYSDNLKIILRKIYKRDKTKYEAIMNKIQEVINSQDPNHYKNLRHNMKDSKRVHIGHFVLTFKVIGDKIYFDDFDHHDNIYKK
ncbi:MAG: addiction module toxin RelE [Candidatus Nanoarchaeia archaeon]|nr:addiction module toxin RelE [Candidatus Nanoarchaeia archaeon]